MISHWQCWLQFCEPKRSAKISVLEARMLWQGKGWDQPTIRMLKRNSWTGLVMPGKWYISHCFVITRVNQRSGYNNVAWHWFAIIGALVLYGVPWFFVISGFDCLSFFHPSSDSTAANTAFCSVVACLARASPALTLLSLITVRHCLNIWQHTSVTYSSQTLPNIWQHTSVTYSCQTLPKHMKAHFCHLFVSDTA